MGAPQSQEHGDVSFHGERQCQTQNQTEGPRPILPLFTQACCRIIPLTDCFKFFRELYEYSIENRSAFYQQLFSWANLIYEGSYFVVVDETATIDEVPCWFSGVRLNWAENLLFSRGASDFPGHHGVRTKEDDKIAVTEIREGNSQVRQISWRELRDKASRLAAALRVRGIERGDRIIVVGANSIETLFVFMATTWLGAIFSSSSTDMGVRGILQRAVQIDPKASLLPSRRTHLN